jgi:glycosyltransferase involved in cell wall biosynthesis
MARRVLVFAAHFAPHVGGVERFTRELWRRLVRRGYDVAVVTGNTNAAAPVEDVDGLRVTRLPVLKVIQGRLPILLPTPAVVRTIREHARARPDVIVTNTRFFSTSVLGIGLARRWRVPSLHIDHGSEHIPVGSRALGAVAERFDHVVGGWVLRNATRCVGVSSVVARFLEHLGRPGAGVLHNGVDTDAYGRRDPSARARLGIPADRPMVLYVGRLIEDKGVQTLLAAFDAVGRRHGAHLVIAGDGPMMASLRAASARRQDIHLLGFIGPQDVGALLAACDVFAHPSAYPEGLPTAVLEAGAAGAAVIATPMGGTGEVIRSPAEGVLVAPRDAAALAAGLDGLLANRTLREALGAALRERVRQVFDWERVADAAERELEMTVAGASPAGARSALRAP